jgi:Tfp pilus assembly protein PilF
MSENEEPRQTGTGVTLQLALVVGVLLLALIARVFYAWGLPQQWDEALHLGACEEISLDPASLQLPISSPVTNHPLGVLYLTALAKWLGGGNVFVIRLVFVGLSLLGLVGVYRLSDVLFGRRVALVALALAALDRSLVALAPVFLESPAVIALAPWAILSMYRCGVRGLGRDWVLAGLLLGLGSWLSTVFLAMLLPFGLYLLFTRRLGAALRTPWMYAGIALMLAMMSPYHLADVLSAGVNYERNVSKIGSLGLSPRMALLYVGDLMLCLKETTWIIRHVGSKMYAPVYVPCNWLMGAVYLTAIGASLRYWRDERVGLLLSVIVGFLVPVTVLDAREPWNEFTWASSTVFAAILLTAFVFDQRWAGKRGRVANAAMLIYAAGALLWFLAGPKWGYSCPEWERAYVGRVLTADFRSELEPGQWPRNEAIAAINDMTSHALKRNPDSVAAWYFRAFYAEDESRREAALSRALELDPDDPLLLQERAENLMDAGNLAEAKQILEHLSGGRGQSAEVFRLLAELEYSMGNYATAAAHAQRAVVLRPEDRRAYRALFAIYDALGESAEAEAALSVYAAKHPAGPTAAFLSMAEAFWQQGDPVKTRLFLERAAEATPNRAGVHSRIGFFFAHKLADTDQAIRHFEAAVGLGSTDPIVYFNLGLAETQRQRVQSAIDYYRKAVELNPRFAEAHLNLGVLLSQQNRAEESQIHLRAAEQLGLAPP